MAIHFKDNFENIFRMIFPLPLPLPLDDDQEEDDEEEEGEKVGNIEAGFRRKISPLCSQTIAGWRLRSETETENFEKFVLVNYFKHNATSRHSTI
jgi:hypothetical protein